MSRKRVLYVTGIVCAVLLVAAFSVTPGFAAPLTDDPDPPEGGVPKTGSYFCEDNPGVEHPVGSHLAAAFDVSYDLVMEWFCEDEMGFGQIMLALTTAEVPGGEAKAADFLARRAGGEGWGQIWRSLDLIGRGRLKADGETDGVGSPEDAGPPGNRGRSDGVGPGEDRGRHLGHFKDRGR